MVLQQLLENQRFSIQGARFRVRNIVGLPPLIWTWDDVDFRASTLLVLTSSILITDLFNLEDKRGGKGRSLADDQLEIFGSIERSLSSVGVEGRPCLLRFICEMHQRPIGRNSILGEVFDVVFSPKPSLVDVLHDYSVASERGIGGGDCAAAYAACPMSLLALMKAGQDQSDYEQAVSGPQDGQRLAVTKVQADQIRIGDTETTGGSSHVEDDPFDDNSPNHLYNTGIPIWQ